MRAEYDGLTADYSYNPNGDVTRVRWSTGLTEQYGYSSQGEPLDRSVAYPGHGALESEAVNLDGLGRKSQVAFTLPDAVRTHTYTYDALGQLVGSTRRFRPTAGGTDSIQTYAYDGNANRVRSDAQRMAYNGADRITSITPGQNPVYDGSGSIQRDHTQASYSYDWRDQLTNVSSSTTTARYTYLQWQQPPHGQKCQRR